MDTLRARSVRPLTVMRALLLWSLLVLVPLGNVRMICYDLASSGTGAATSGADCDDMCERPPADPAETGCVLVAGGCTSVLAVLIALPVPVLPLGIPAVEREHPFLKADIYLPPALSSHLRPPRV